MFAKKLIAAAVALVAMQGAYADDKLVDSVAIDYGNAAKVQMVRFSAAKDCLQAVIRSVAPAGGVPALAVQGDPAAGQVATVTSGTPQDRRQALAQLRVVADFFRRTEPHSPVAYLADKAASWGDMPLHVWLRAVIKDPAAIASVEELLGAQAAASE